MKIGVISTPVFALGNAGLSGYGGLEQIAWQCAKGLAAKGHAVTLFAPQGSACPGADVFPIGPAGHWDEKTAYSQYWKELLKLDVILDHTWQKWSYILKAEGQLRAPVVSTLHAPANTMYGSLPPGVDKPCFVCISDDQKAHFEALHGRPARRVYNGICLEHYRPIEGVKRTNRYLFLARFSSVKSPDVNIDVCRAAGVGLDLIGDVSITNEPDYFRLCQSKADGQQIRIIGGVSRGEAVMWYSRAHAFCHICPRFREPFGLAPVEAQACGLPVLCFDYGAVRETVRTGETGYVVSSTDDAVALIKDGAMEEINRQACRENAARFSVENMVNGYEKLCEEAVDGGGW